MFAIFRNIQSELPLFVEVSFTPVLRSDVVAQFTMFGRVVFASIIDYRNISTA